MSAHDKTDAGSASSSDGVSGIEFGRIDDGDETYDGKVACKLENASGQSLIGEIASVIGLSD